MVQCCLNISVNSIFVSIVMVIVVVISSVTGINDMFMPVIAIIAFIVIDVSIIAVAIAIIVRILRFEAPRHPLCCLDLFAVHEPRASGPETKTTNKQKHISEV